MESIKNLTNEECLKWSEKALEKSKEKWESSVLIAKSGYYESAISGYIISMEELIKALILSFDSIGFEFRKVEGIDIVLRKSHKMRHFILYLSFVLLDLLEDIVVFFKKVEKEPEILRNLFERQKDGIIHFKIKYAILRKVIKYRREMDWFEKIENIRMSSNHTDYDIIKTISTTPIKSEHEFIYQRLRKLRVFMLKWINSTKNFSDEEQESHLQALTTMHEKGIYKSLGIAIKAARKDPFEKAKIVKK